MCETLNLEVADRIRDVADFFLQIRGLFLLIALFRAASGRVLASVCEAQLCFCVGCMSLVARASKLEVGKRFFFKRVFFNL